MALYCTERFVAVPLSLIQSNLDSESLAIAVHILAETVGRQRTQADVSKEAIGRRAKLSWRPTQRAFDDLQSRGLLTLTRGVRSVGGFCTRVTLNGALGAAFTKRDAPPAHRDAPQASASPAAPPPPRIGGMHPRESEGCTPAIPRGSSNKMKNIQETSSSNEKPVKADVVVPPEQLGPFSVLRSWGVPVKRALQDLLSYPLEAVQKAIRIAQHTPNAQNPPALYTTALREGWELPAAARSEDEKQRKIAGFQARLALSTSELPPPAEQPIPQTCQSPFTGLSHAEIDEVRLEARRRVARLLGRTLERVTDANPLLEGVMLEVIETRRGLSVA